MKSYILSLLGILISLPAWGTSTLERNLAECSISTEDYFEEIILKFVQTEDADQNIYADYVLDYTYGDLYGESVDIMGRHEQLRKRIFTSAMAEGDGVIALGSRDYQMISVFDRSEVIINLEYEGRDQDNFATYSLSLDGEGPVFELAEERFQAILADSEHYGRYDDPLCVTHFDLDEFVTE